MNIGALNNFSHTVSAAQSVSTAAAAQAENRNEEASLNISESFTPSQGNSVNLIVQGDEAALNTLKAELLADGKNNKLTADLPLIGGFAVSVSPQDEDTITSLAQAKRQGVVISADAFEDCTSDSTVSQDLDEIHNLMAGLKPEKQANVMFGVEQLHERGITGKGTTICVIDTGIAPHPDFDDRIIGFKDFVNGKSEPYDDEGHGTHCAGICAGSGASSDGQITGVAPEANIVGVKVLDRFGGGSTSQILKGIQWAVMNKNKYGIDVITMSLGHPIEKTRFLDPLTMGVQAAAKFGITVVVAAGNDGPKSGTLNTPGNAPAAITVGALDDKGTEDPGDDGIAFFSSRGPSRFDNIDKPDVVAPGVDIYSCGNNGGYKKMSGTSMATPFTAGLAALMKQQQPDLRPKDIKQIIMDSANPLEHVDKTAQGAGAVDPKAAIDAISGPRKVKVLKLTRHG